MDRTIQIKPDGWEMFAGHVGAVGWRCWQIEVELPHQRVHSSHVRSFWRWAQATLKRKGVLAVFVTNPSNFHPLLAQMPERFNVLEEDPRVGGIWIRFQWRR